MATRNCSEMTRVRARLGISAVTVRVVALSLLRLFMGRGSLEPPMAILPEPAYE